MSWRDVRPFSWAGTIDRLPFVVIGCLLVVVKFLVDAAVALAFHQTWSPLIYWLPGRWQEHASSAGVQATFLIVMLAISLPFAWVGVGMTLRRLRELGLPPWLAVFFFIPGLNALFFAALIALPSRTTQEAPPQPARSELSLGTTILRTGGAAILFGIPAVVLSTVVLRNYGYSLFLGLPFALGMIPTFALGRRHEISLKRSLLVTCSVFGLFALAMVALQVEGLACILMALPFALVLALLGVAVAHAVLSTRRRQAAGASLSAMVIVLPALMGIEHGAALPSRTIEVVTSVDVDAPPDVVWRHVIAFPDLPPDTDFVFRAGIASPIGATIDGAGVGAIRHCRFSTGDFIEPVTTWDPPRLLAFDVTESPPPMVETNPFGKVHPPHLHGFMISERGQFRLVPLPGGGTRLEGTTWYRHGLFPAAYWRLWSDALIHRIHARVLEHVKTLSESERGTP